MSDIGLSSPPGSIARPRHTGLIGRLREALARTDAIDFCAGFSVAIIWALGHTLAGIEGDSRIYMGRALADLDPFGIGRDLMFAMDGQSSFTVFRIIARNMVAAVGLGPTVEVLSFVNLAVWFLALVAFARALVPGRALGLVLVVACVLPRLYTPWNLLAAGESIPVPRPLAEAGVLFALAAMIHGRLILATICLVAAALFHPIMAAPGFAMLLLALGLRDWRWLAGAGLAGIALVVATVAGVPALLRFAAKVDAEWLQLLLERNPYLFLHFWRLDVLGPIVVQATTILIACRWLEKPARTILIGSLAVAVAGCAASYLLGDLLTILLALQAQLWRALWLPAVLAPIAAGICLVRLSQHGPRGQLALPLLCLAWAALDVFPLAPLAAIAAAACAYAPEERVPASRVLVVVLWLLAAILAAGSMLAAVTVLRTMTAGMPGGFIDAWGMVWSLRFQTIPFVLLFAAWWFAPRAAFVRIVMPLFMVAAAILLFVTFDPRTPAHRDADAATLKPDLVEMLASRPGPVLWVDGDDVWYWAGRPNWNGQTQGGGIVFSRPLGMEWLSRARRMLDHGLATRYLLKPWGAPISLRALPLDREKILDFCRQPDAPAWVVASLEPDAQPTPGLDARVWSPPAGHWKVYINGTTVRWRHLDRYAVVPCAPASR